MTQLTHEGETLGQIVWSSKNREVTVGLLVYATGAPQVIGIVRKQKPLPPDSYGNVSQYEFQVLVEWPTGRRVWRSSHQLHSIDAKIKEEQRALAAFIKARDEAKKQFGL